MKQIKQKKGEGAGLPIAIVIIAAILIITFVAIIPTINKYRESSGSVTDATETQVATLNDLIKIRGNSFDSLPASEQTRTVEEQIEAGALACETYDTVLENLASPEYKGDDREEKQAEAYKKQITCLTKDNSVNDKCERAEAKLKGNDKYLDDKYAEYEPEEVYAIVGLCYKEVGKNNDAQRMFAKFLEEKPQGTEAYSTARINQENVEINQETITPELRAKLGKSFGELKTSYDAARGSGNAQRIDEAIQKIAGFISEFKAIEDKDFGGQAPKEIRDKVATAYYYRGQLAGEKETDPNQKCKVKESGFGELLTLSTRYQLSILDGTSKRVQPVAIREIGDCYREINDLENAAERYEVLFERFPEEQETLRLLSPRTEETLVPNCASFETRDRCLAENAEFQALLSTDLERQLRCYYDEPSGNVITEAIGFYTGSAICRSCQDIEKCEDYPATTMCDEDPCGLENCQLETQVLVVKSCQTVN